MTDPGASRIRAAMSQQLRHRVQQAVRSAPAAPAKPTHPAPPRRQCCSLLIVLSTSPPGTAAAPSVPSPPVHGLLISRPHFPPHRKDLGEPPRPSKTHKTQAQTDEVEGKMERILSQPERRVPVKP